MKNLDDVYLSYQGPLQAIEVYRFLTDDPSAAEKSVHRDSARRAWRFDFAGFDETVAFLDSRDQLLAREERAYMVGMAKAKADYLLLTFGIRVDEEQLYEEFEFDAKLKVDVLTKLMHAALPGTAPAPFEKVFAEVRAHLKRHRSQLLDYIGSAVIPRLEKQRYMELALSSQAGLRA
jgi:hypothetical protein